MMSRNRNANVTRLTAALAIAAACAAAPPAHAAITTDATLVNTAQIDTAPVFTGSAGQINYGLNFHYSGGGVGTFMGIGFDDIDVTGLPAGPINLAANVGNAGSTVSFVWNTFTADNTERTQASGVVGTDAATINALALKNFYLNDPNPPLDAVTHESTTITFAGLAPNAEAFVQFVGGGHMAFDGDILVNVNGVDLPGLWTSVTDGDTNTPGLFAFTAMTDGLGELNLNLTVQAVTPASGVGFAYVSGLILAVEVPLVVPAPAALPAGLTLIALAAVRRRRPRA